LVAEIAALGTPRGGQNGNRGGGRDDAAVEKNATPARFRRENG